MLQSDHGSDHGHAPAHVFWQSAAPFAVARRAAVAALPPRPAPADWRAKARQHPHRYGAYFRSQHRRGMTLNGEQRATRRRLLVRLYCELECTIRDCANLFSITPGRVAQILRLAGVTLRRAGTNVYGRRAA